MKLKINGESKTVEVATLADLIQSLGLNPKGLAVAVNMEVVARGSYDGVELHEGDEVEIVTAVGGG